MNHTSKQLCDAQTTKQRSKTHSDFIYGSISRYVVHCRSVAIRNCVLSLIFTIYSCKSLSLSLSLFHALFALRQRICCLGVVKSHMFAADRLRTMEEKKRRGRYDKRKSQQTNTGDYTTKIGKNSPVVR